MSGAGVRLTIDRAGDVMRCALWRQGTLIDLYADRISAPDYAGTPVLAKVLRVRPSGKKKAAFLEAGLPEHLYVETSAPIAPGALVMARVDYQAGEGKAWPATLTGTNGPEPPRGAPLGPLSPPPRPFMRALADMGALGDKAGEPVRLFFSTREDMLEAADLLPQGGRVTAAWQKDSTPAELDEQLALLLSPRVPLAGGGEIVIERTQALTAIDVNAGEASNPLSVNLLALREAARQIRLRQLGGTIVIDALKMSARVDQSKVLNALSRAIAGDPGEACVFGLTKLGLIELTRRRRGPALPDVMGSV